MTDDDFDKKSTGCSSDSRRGARHGGRHRRRGHRKERVLHTRISEPLAEDIRRMADDLRVPVSNLVRNVLEEAFAVVETVSENVGDLIEDVVDEAERTRERIRRQRGRGRRRPAAADASSPDADAARAPRREHPEVLGWQPLIFNRAQVCSDCEEPIERGERGFVGMKASGLSDIHLCRDCVDARR
jgi:hypothetical protein